MPEVALVVWPLLGASRRCLLRTIPVLPGYRVAIVRLTVMIPLLALLPRGRPNGTEYQVN